MNNASEILLNLAKQITEPYTKLPTIRAAMITGSVAKGLADHFSDIDMTMYYEGELPPQSEFDRLRIENGAPDNKWLIGNPETGSFAAAYDIKGVGIQIGHTTIESWENDIKTILVDCETDTPLHKAMEGTLASLVLYGETYMEKWKAQISAYPDQLAEAMVRNNLQFFPIWGLLDNFGPRDTTLWVNQIVVEASHKLIGALAGLNRLYFTTFQFKRMGYFIDQMEHKPENFAARIESLFNQDMTSAAFELEKLIGETVTLIDKHMPQIDTSVVKRRIGWRQKPWIMQD